MVHLTRIGQPAENTTPVRRIFIHYYGRWYPGYVARIVGKGAWTDFRTTGRHFGSWRQRWVSPERHGAHLTPPWAKTALTARGVEYETLGKYVDALLRGQTQLTLAGPGFEEQALANALDRLACAYVVNRGPLPRPRIPLW